MLSCTIETAKGNIHFSLRLCCRPIPQASNQMQSTVVLRSLTYEGGEWKKGVSYQSCFLFVDDVMVVFTSGTVLLLDIHWLRPISSLGMHGCMLATRREAVWIDFGMLVCEEGAKKFLSMTRAILGQLVLSRDSWWYGVSLLYSTCSNEGGLEKRW